MTSSRGDERLLFRRLAVFADGCTSATATTVCGGGEFGEIAVLDLITRLVDRSLVVAEVVTTGTRYRLLETVRQYAAEQLAASADEERDIRDRHLMWCASLAPALAADLHTPQQDAALATFDRELANFRHALEWSVESQRPDVGLGIVAALGRFWMLRWKLQEAEDWYERLLPEAPTAPPEVRASALVELADVRWVHAEFDDARRLFVEGLVVFEQVGDPVGAANAIKGLGDVAAHLGDHSEAVARYEKAVDLYREAGASWGVRICTINLGYVAISRRGSRRRRPALRGRTSSQPQRQRPKWHRLLPLRAGDRRAGSAETSIERKSSIASLSLCT